MDIKRMLALIIRTSLMVFVLLIAVGKVVQSVGQGCGSYPKSECCVDYAGVLFNQICTEHCQGVSCPPRPPTNKKRKKPLRETRTNRSGNTDRNREKKKKKNRKNERPTTGSIRGGLVRRKRLGEDRRNRKGRAPTNLSLSEEESTNQTFARRFRRPGPTPRTSAIGRVNPALRSRSSPKTNEESKPNRPRRVPFRPIPRTNERRGVSKPSVGFRIRQEILRRKAAEQQGQTSTTPTGNTARNSTLKTIRWGKFRSRFSRKNKANKGKGVTKAGGGRGGPRGATRGFRPRTREPIRLRRTTTARPHPSRLIRPTTTTTQDPNNDRIKIIPLPLRKKKPTTPKPSSEEDVSELELEQLRECWESHLTAENCNSLTRIFQSTRDKNENKKPISGKCGVAPDYTPCVPLEEANKSFSDCCESFELGECAALCNYKLDSGSARNIILSGRCRHEHMQPFMQCMSGFRSAESCCGAQGVGREALPQCQGFCDPLHPLGPLGIQHLSCVNNFQQILRCHHANVRNKPEKN